MTTYRLIYAPSKCTVAILTRAENWRAKGWGVLGRAVLLCGEGLWLPGVASVHTLFVRFPMDLLFLDKNLRTVKASPDVTPGRWLVQASGAAHTLELGAGTLASLKVPIGSGDAWELAQE